MNALQKTLAAATLGLTAIANTAAADDLATVKTFYDIFTNPSPQTHAAFLDAASDDWKSYADYSGKYQVKEEYIPRSQGIAAFMPDLKFSIEAMHQHGNFVTVRSRSKATPAGEFMGIDPQGRNFDIMNIDIHELKDGKLVNLWHIEDWATAMRQMSGK
ncbi:MAG: ester cyclase [Hyphomicrobiales bacterium]